MPLFEVCVDDAAGLAACENQADRIELCSALDVGGLTPSPGLIAQAAHSPKPVFAMIRPRAGDFDFDPLEIETCLADIAAVRAAGLSGVVLGAARDGALDLPALTRMSDAAHGLARTLHRVIDTLTDPCRAVEQAIDLGFTTILTSGGAAKAPDGIALLAQMQQVAAGRITIMAGSGVTPETVGQIAHSTGIQAFHASCSRAVDQAETARHLGFARATRQVTCPTQLIQMRAAVDQLGPGTAQS